MKTTTRTEPNTKRNRFLIEANISLILVVNSLKENKFTSDEVLKILLNMTLSFTNVDVDLETSGSNSSYQTWLYINQDQFKRSIPLSFSETDSYIILLE